MFAQAEANVKIQKPVPMDLRAVLEKLRGELKSNKEEWSGVKEGSGEGSGRLPWELGGNKADMSESDKMVAEIMAMHKGKGKGKGVECYNCGKLATWPESAGQLPKERETKRAKRKR